MPKFVDFHQADDPRDIIHQVVQALAEGQVVGLPTETSYVAAASSLSADAVARMARRARALGPGRCALALRNQDEAWDYVPGSGPLAQKLVRRFWPGPVTLIFDPPPERGLSTALPAETRESLIANDGLAIRLPAHEVLGAVGRLLPAPLVVSDEIARDASRFSTPAELTAAFGDALSLSVDAGPCRYGQTATVVRVGPEKWDVVREGVVTRRTLERLAGTLFLFVCTGNTCRSPMAEALFRKLLAERLGCTEDELVDRGYVVASAGVSAALGGPPSPEAVEILEPRGVDLRAHESQPVTPQLLSQADQIFTMTRNHREQLIYEFPEAAPRVRLLDRDGSDIMDPIGAGLDEYRRSADQIERSLRDIIDSLPELSGKPNR